MSKQYPGGIISKTPPVPTQVAASGVWTLDQQAYWQKLGQWPTPGYKIQRSLRFNEADESYLTRSFTSTGNQQKWTWSAWVKRSALTEAFLFGRSGATNDSGYLNIQLAGSAYSQLNFSNYSGSINVTTTQVLRDVSAWYHIVFALDTTQATAADRLKIYVNGVQVTAFSATAYPSLNESLIINAADGHVIGARQVSTRTAYNGYMTEINFVNAQQLTPSSFGETNADTGVWSPMPYAGAYGTNGFYLNFLDNSNTTAATLGKDYSGNGNNWTPNNFSVTAGAGNDSMVDVPTPYGTDTGAGGEVRGNYCTFNPLFTGGTLANGNLDFSAASGVKTSLSTIALPTSGKWYWEVTVTAVGNSFQVGIGGALSSGTNYLGSSSDAYAYSANAVKYNNGSSTAYGASYTTNDVIAVAYDADAGTLVFYKNNTSQGTAFSSLSGTFFPAVSYGSSSGSGSCTINMGQRAFAYTAPSGFKALCTQNLPTPTIGSTTATTADKFFAPVTFTSSGTGSITISSLSFQPDFTWWKSRATVVDHYLMDVLRGNSTYLASNRTLADQTYSNIWTPSSSGWTSSNGSFYNNDSNVAWNWKANGSGSTNTAGSITSTVSASTTSGFSVVTYTGTGANATVGHGLGVAPSMVIIKARSFTQVWVVGHSSIGFGNYLLLNATDASASGSNVFNSTAPTSTVFSLGSGGGGNQSAATYVAYCFAPIAGYSAFGSYTGNGSANGPFIYTGFRPAFVMVKNTAAGESWLMFDTARNTSNVTNNKLAANSSVAENDASIGDSTQNNFDFLSNGFKAVTTNSGTNGSSAVIIYMAFASNPFKYSLAR